MKSWIVAVAILVFGATSGTAQYRQLEERDWDRRRDEQRLDERRADELRQELQRLEGRIQEFHAEEARREDFRREAEARREREGRGDGDRSDGERGDGGGYGRWNRAEHPYEERVHEFCQQRGRQAAAMERDVAAGRSNHDERTALIALKTALDQQCGGYRWRG